MSKRTIIVPLDGSAFSRQIVPQLCRICDPAADTLVLLHVAEPVERSVAAPPRPMSVAWSAPMYNRAWDTEYAQHEIYASQIEQSERSALEQEFAGDRQMLEALGFKVMVEVRFGDPASEIVAAARQHGADLIALATHGRTGLRQLLMGSVAERVLRRAPLPVLVMRPFNVELPG